MPETINITPTWEATVLIYAEVFAASRSPTARDGLVAIGRGLDFLNTLHEEDDGSLTLGSADMQKFKRIVRGEKEEGEEQ